MFETCRTTEGCTRMRGHAGICINGREYTTTEKLTCPRCKNTAVKLSKDKHTFMGAKRIGFVDDQDDEPTFVRAERRANICDQCVVDLRKGKQ